MTNQHEGLVMADLINEGFPIDAHVCCFPLSTTGFVFNQLLIVVILSELSSDTLNVVMKLSYERIGRVELGNLSHAGDEVNLQDLVV